MRSTPTAVSPEAEKIVFEFLASDDALHAWCFRDLAVRLCREAKQPQLVDEVADFLAAAWKDKLVCCEPRSGVVQPTARGKWFARGASQ